MKRVLLHILYNEGLEFENVECETVEEAREAAEISTHYKPLFYIYTLHSSGKAKGIDWNLGSKKETKNKSRGGAWTDDEIEELISNLGSGLSVSASAKAMKRTYNSVYVKRQELKKDGKL